MQQQFRLEVEAHAYLELKIKAHSVSPYVADLYFYHSDSNCETALATNVPMALDPPALPSVTNNPSEYSRQLTTAVFSAASMREAWARVLGYIQKGNTILHLCVRLDTSAEALHHLRWELLCEPTSGLPLCRSECFLFSRYLDTADLTQVQRPLRNNAHTLIALANPNNLYDYKLAPIDVYGELNRIKAALADLPFTVVATQLGATTVTRENLFAELRKGYPIIYLQCHGTMNKGNPYLWLERADGSCNPVAGVEFVQLIATLPATRRPVLIVLASCQSVGADDTRAFSATLGPQLAHAGVLAVIGMQGNIPVTTLERMMPHFFQTLLADGQVDHALAMARAQLSNDDPWWTPVLFTRARDGRIWTTEPTHHRLNEMDNWHVKAPIREALTLFLADFHDISRQIQVFNTYKRLHDQLHDLRFECFNCLNNDILQHYSDPDSQKHLNEQIFVLQRIIGILYDIVDKAGVAGITREQIWIRQLDHAWEELCQVVETPDKAILDRSVGLIERILDIEPVRINQILKDTAESLRLPRLIELIARVQAILVHHGNMLQLQQLFNEGMTALNSLNQTMDALVREHDAWQDLERNLRLFQLYLDKDYKTELTQFWPEIRAQAIPLYAERDEYWADIFIKQDQRMETAMCSGNSERIRMSFMDYQRQAGLRLFLVDKQLIDVCHELQLVGKPINTILRMLV